MASDIDDPSKWYNTGQALRNPFQWVGRKGAELFDWATETPSVETARAAGAPYEARPSPGLTPEDLRARTSSLADVLTGRVAGSAPSPAELQLRKGLESQLAMANALAASGAGASNPGLAQRTAAFSADRAGSAFNADAAILRAQEQAAAETRLMQLLGGNQNVALGQTGLNDAQSRFAQDLQYDADADRLGTRRKVAAGGVETVGQTAAMMADGGIVAGPTEAMLGEAGPEAVVPLTSPADAALAAMMIDKARKRMATEQMVADALSGSMAPPAGDVDLPPKGPAEASVGGQPRRPAQRGGRGSGFGRMLGELVQRQRMQEAEDRARAMAALAVRLTGGKVHQASAASLDDAAMRGGAMGALASRLTGAR